MPAIAVTFDVHGTLILPEPDICSIYAERARRFDHIVEVEALRQRFLPAFKEVRGRWPIPYGRDEVDARRFWRAVTEATFAGLAPAALHDDLFEHFAEGTCWRVLPGVREALALLQQRQIPFAFCSNFDARVRRILAALALPTERVFFSSEVGAAKPDPTMLIQAAALMQVAPRDLLHVGDHPLEDGGAAAAIDCTWMAVDRERGIEVAALAEFLAQHA